MENYNFKQTEKKWQKYWEDNKTFAFDKNKPNKFYMLEMFPYPSGELHTGHLRNFAIGDVVARFKRMQGYNVLHPMGADAFGLPAENAAIKKNLSPNDWTRKNIEKFIANMKILGLSYDYDRFVATCFPEYYGKQQKIFLDLFKQGLAYQKESLVNWDPVDQTVLANEQVVEGRGWRSGALVEKKKLRQWFFRITNYAEELLQDIDKLEGWSDKVRLMQKNWIGKSEGAIVKFQLASDTQPPAGFTSSPLTKGGIGQQEFSSQALTKGGVTGSSIIEVYTTRPDTLYGASFLAIAANHPLAEALAQNSREITDFLEECKQSKVDEETLETMEKKGVNTGLEVLHPFDKNIKLPVFIANFIVMDYGTGALFGCPAHDARDYEFATKYNLPIRPVVAQDDLSIPELPFTENGIAVNSDFLNGLTTAEAKKAAIAKIEEMQIGERKTNYRLRDWGFSRQRYWGCPIPVVYCDKCGVVPLKEEDLPLKLPDDVEFTGKGNPLANHPTWKHTKCPCCGGEATRETDTMDTFVDSSWYFLRYIDLTEDKPFNAELCQEIMPVDQYVGGIEHATMHLIYCRFFTKALRDCGYFKIDEPIKKLFNQGMVCHKAYRGKQSKDWCYPWLVEEKSGKYYNSETQEELNCEGVIKMSKSKSNVVDNEKIVNAYGADAARIFVLSDSPADKDFEWTEQGIEGCWKYINRLWRLIIKDKDDFKITDNKPQLDDIVKNTHKTTRDVSNHLENLEFNKAIARIREFTNFLEKIEKKDNSYYLALATVIKLLAPFTPHLSAELMEVLKIEDTSWPTYNPDFVADDTITIALQINGKLRGTMDVEVSLSQEELRAKALEEPNIKRYITGEIKKIIVVPNKLINIVL